MKERNNMKKAFKIVLIILAVVIIVIAGGIFFLTNGLEAGKNVEISSIDASSVKDGVYEGSYDSGRWSNKVAVTVKAGKITDIQIKDDVAFAKEGLSDELFGRVIGSQNTDVDAVTGATVTCKAYLKAIENALKSGK
jgi:uncharacterized protein with FMN-binding domain